MHFVNLFVQDYFSCKVVKDKLALDDKTVCDWASYAHDMLVGPFDKNEKLVVLDKLLK